jgi:hypothetical protein
MFRFLLLLVLALLMADAISAEEIDIVKCDVLPVVEVRVSGLKFHFLVDTAATSFLNIRSFRVGEAKTVGITSWSGTTDAKAKRVTIDDLSLGDHHFRNVVLPAVDLSGIGRACGRQIDGILGIDLLLKLGAVVDLRDHTVRLRIGTETTEERVQQLSERILSCEEAFNRGDETAVSDCFDPEVVIFRSVGDFHGRAGLIEFLRGIHLRARPEISVKPYLYHVVGEVIWIEYESCANIGEKKVRFQGTALWSSAGGKWRVALVTLGTAPDDAIAASHH